jgi:hypothetical protein
MGEDTDVQQEKLGDTFNLFLDRNGYIVFIQAVDSAFSDYMLVLDANTDNYKNVSSGTPKVYALLDSDTYKTLSADEDLDDETNFYTEAAGFVNTGSIGALVGYKLDDSGKLSDVTFIGNASTGTNGNDKYSKPVGKVNSFDDDTYKIDVNGTKYLLTDNTKIFIYKSGALGYSNDTARDNSKVVTASELAEIKSGDTTYSATAAAVVMAGSSNSSTIEAIALEVNDAYFKASAGDKYPALISSITQSIVSGSSSKYDYEISAYINGEKKSLKTEQQTNSTFVSDVLVKNSAGKKFESAAKAKNKFAWITVNGEGIVTKIEPAYEAAPNEAKENEWTSTRAIVVGKTTKGITYIAADSWKLTNGEVATTDSSKFNVSYKTTNSNFAAFANESYIYSIDVRPAYHEITNSVKQDDLDKDYECSSAQVADIQVSTITDSTATNVYYIADLFFNDDGDIMAVFTYEKDLTKATTSSNNKETENETVSASTGSGTIGSPIKFTVTNPVSGGYVQTYFDDRGETKTVYSADNTFTLGAAVGNAKVPTLTGGVVEQNYIAQDANGNKTYYTVTYTSTAAEGIEDALEAVSVATAATTAATAEVTSTKATYDGTQATVASGCDADKTIGEAGTALANAQADGSSQTIIDALQAAYDKAVAEKAALVEADAVAAKAYNDAVYAEALATLKEATANADLALAMAAAYEAEGDTTSAAACRANAKAVYENNAKVATTFAENASNTATPSALNTDYAAQFTAYAEQMTEAAKAID